MVSRKGTEPMKTMKTVSLLTALLLVLLLASCGTGTPESENETIPESTVSAQEAGFTIEDVLRENSVRTLVSAYGGVQAMLYSDDQMYSETYYFMYAGKLVSTCRTADPDEEYAYSCTVDSERYDKVGDHLQFAYDLEPDSSGDSESFEPITVQIPDGTIQWIEAPDEDTWRFEVRDEKDPSVVCRCVVTRQTLTLKQIEVDYGKEGGTTRIELTHGSEVQTKEFGMLDGFAQKLRTVTCVCTFHDKSGKPTEKTYKLEVPYNVEPLWVASREVNVYLNKELTKEYSYPGNGEEGYTVYVTDAMG